MKTISIFLLVACSSLPPVQATVAPGDQRPNILFCIMDDASWAHMSAYGCDWVQTPAFDQVAREGILFRRAYTSNAKCAPSRASILTGRNSWELEQIGNHIAVWPEQKYPTYCEVLERHGYFVGMTAKGWGPGIIENDAKRQLTGRPFGDNRVKPPAKGISGEDYSANFKDFLEANTEGKPWCFWYGSREPHRRYEYGTGVRLGGRKTQDIEAVPTFWPDNETVRNDMLDYGYEIEYFDKHLGRMLRLLQARGELDNTLVVVTSDNGMPFPRSKGLGYEYSNHMPLAIMWPRGIKNPGRTEEGFVSFVDFSPTFLKVAGIDWASSGMEPTSGKDLLEIFYDSYRKQDRSYILLGQERHDYGRPGNQGYPIRSIIRDGFLYLHNFKPHLWPVGNPETGYLNTDGSPTKSLILKMRREGVDSRFWQWNFGKHPGEELYHIAVDPDCILNLAESEAYRDVKASLKEKLFADLAHQGDPRVVGPDPDIFDKYPFQNQISYDFYERFMRGEIKEYQTGWVNPTDYESQTLDN
jgi:N-sulfoglucosamine sulfohydrolase